jgi:hypothetical protein
MGMFLFSLRIRLNSNSEVVSCSASDAMKGGLEVFYYDALVKTRHRTKMKSKVSLRLIIGGF